MVAQAPSKPNLRIESTPRWIRGFVAGKPIVNSKHAVLVYGERRLALYYFPRKDVRLDMLQEGRKEGGVQFYNLGAIEDVAWQHLEDGEAFSPLREFVGFEWRKVESWYEEDEEVFVHPRDPYHRIDVLESSRHVKVVLDGEVIAESQRPRLLFETGLITRYYLPRVDVRLDMLEPSATRTQCPYKGTAQYYSVRVGDKLHEDVIWYYPFTTAESIKAANLLAFYNERVDLYIDGELQERPTSPRRPN